MNVTLPKKIEKGLEHILKEFQELHGVAIGGSVANGSYKIGDDVDVDLLLESYSGASIQRFSKRIEDKFQVISDVPLEIRAVLRRRDYPEKESVLYHYPQTIFYLRSQKIKEIWNIPDDRRIIYLKR